jgi:hypothetical protein
MTLKEWLESDREEPYLLTSQEQAVYFEVLAGQPESEHDEGS